MMYIENKEFGDRFNNKKEFERTDKNFYINRGDFEITTTTNKWKIDFHSYRYNEPDFLVINTEKVPSYILDWLENTGFEVFKR